MKHHQYQHKFFLSLGCFLAAGLLMLAQIRLEQYQLAREIAPEILRFHVMANSNSQADQRLKLQVKSYLLEQIYTDLEQQKEAWTKEDLTCYLTKNQKSLEEKAEAFIRSQGKDYPVSLTLASCEFPEKYYGDLRLPAGTYQAANVTIGAGRGHNWWCVLYPKICITKDALTTVPESSLQELQQILSQENYQALLSERPVIHIDFRIREILSSLLS